jgi:hypothetical protein
MKLQIDGLHLRMRLSEEQLDTLLREGRVAAILICPDGQPAERSLILDSDLAEPACDGNLMHLTMRLPQAQFLVFAAQRHRRDGLSFTTGALRVDVEVDVRDSHRRGIPKKSRGIDSGQ